jgi:hypothetical protein
MAASPLLLSGSITQSPASSFPCTLTLLPGASPFPGGAADVAAWVQANLPALLALLQSHGAVLFRGFPLATAACFSTLVSAFGWADLPYCHSLSLAVRTPVCDRVCTTNDGRAGGLVFHHEQAAAPLFPSHLFFFAEVPAAPGAGGGTGLSPSWQLLPRLAAAHPAFVADCERLGVLYRLTLPEAQDDSKGVGRSWKSFFGVDSRSACEQRMAALGYSHTWGQGGLLHAQTPVLPPVRAVPGPSGPATRVFFNQIMAQALGNAAEFAAQALSAGAGSSSSSSSQQPCLAFGDGSPIPLEPVQYALQVCEELAVDVQWQQGDVAVVDNMLVMHARRPWVGEGPRRVLASLAVAAASS